MNVKLCLKYKHKNKYINKKKRTKRQLSEDVIDSQYQGHINFQTLYDIMKITYVLNEIPTFNNEDTMSEASIVNYCNAEASIQNI